MITHLAQTRTAEAPQQPRYMESLLQLDQAVLDAMPIGLYACDAAGLIVRVNRKAVELWGKRPHLFDPVQKFCGCFRVETLEGQYIPPDETPMSRAVMDGQSFRAAEAVVHNADGRRWVARVDIEPMRDTRGVIIGAINCFQDVTQEHDLRAAAAQQQRTFDLAMLASNMGTWRYTIADNICVYDDKAQGLYGLDEANFLHDDEGVKTKFHADDMSVMWERVTKALDPTGDGRYDVEYRVKQKDGSWRWLSAWGLTEFQGEGPDRKPVAISGASRDLTERKKAEQVQQLLLAELNHRVKNTLAIVQSITAQTLRDASDIKSARQALDGRIYSLAKAHDLLTTNNWEGANVADVITRAIKPFEAAKVELSGPAVHVSPKHALALSLAVNELATNAAKYGALSTPEGRVHLHWNVRDGHLHIDWHEKHGPTVAPPTRRGFGSLMIEKGLVSDLQGEVTLNFHAAGVRCEISAPL